MNGLLAIWLFVDSVVAPFAVRLHQKSHERAALAFVRETGGYFQYHWQHDYRYEAPGPEWARQLLGENFFDDVEYVVFEGVPHKLTDDGLARLWPLAHVKSLSFRYANITDDGLRHLVGFHQLAYLDLMYAQVRGPGLQSLSKLPGLKELSLVRTPIDDASLANLRKCKALEHLNLEATNISGSGLAALSRLPHLAEIRLGSKVTTEGLASLQSLKGLRILWLQETNLDDEALKALSNVKSLRALWISSGRITNAGLAHLAQLPKLEDLVLEADVTDEGIASLGQLSALQGLSVGSTAVAGGGIPALLAKWPQWKGGFSQMTDRELWPKRSKEILDEPD